MKRNGFTLIELLAVIVILAIIALIATPIILGIINDAREKANERSIELYASAVKNAIASYQLTHPNAPTTFEDLDVEYDGNVVCAKEELYADGSFYLEGCKVNESEKEYSYSTKQKSDKACILDDKDNNGVASLSDVVTCGTENFYVMYNENAKITMLSMYNLYVGDSCSDLFDCVELENPTNKQSEIAKGYLSGNTINHAVLFLSERYVNEYERILKEELKVSSATATVITYDQANDLKLNKGNPSWIYSTSYWMATYEEGSDHMIWVVWNGKFGTGDSTEDRYLFGIRPVITISTSEIK